MLNTNACKIGCLVHQDLFGLSERFSLMINLCSESAKRCHSPDFDMILLLCISDLMFHDGETVEGWAEMASIHKGASLGGRSMSSSRIFLLPCF